MGVVTVWLMIAQVESQIFENLAVKRKAIIKSKTLITYQCIIHSALLMYDFFPDGECGKVISG